jgi:hypothetical protein
MRRSYYEKWRCAPDCSCLSDIALVMRKALRVAFAIALVAPLLAATVVQGAAQKQSALPSAIAVGIFVDGAQSGSGIYLKSGLVITAAHLTSVDARMSVKIAGGVLPATVLKQGSFEDVDLSLLSVDQKKL